VKNIGKSCAEEPHTRFFEGGLKELHLVFHSSCVRQTDVKETGAVSSLSYLVFVVFFVLTLIITLQ
jgi:hypothetical protein